MRCMTGSPRDLSFTHSLLSVFAAVGTCCSGIEPISESGRIVSTMICGSFSSRTEILPRTMMPALSLMYAPPESSAR